MSEAAAAPFLGVKGLTKSFDRETVLEDVSFTLAERHTPKLKKLWACKCGSRNCTGTMLQKKK